MYVCMCIYIHTHTHTHTHIYIYIYILPLLQLLSVSKLSIPSVPHQNCECTVTPTVTIYSQPTLHAPSRFDFPVVNNTTLWRILVSLFCTRTFSYWVTWRFIASLKTTDHVKRRFSTRTGRKQVTLKSQNETCNVMYCNVM